MGVGALKNYQKIAECANLGCLERIIKYLSRIFFLPDLADMMVFFKAGEGNVSFIVECDPGAAEVLPKFTIKVESSLVGPNNDRYLQRAVMLTCYSKDADTVRISGTLDSREVGPFCIWARDDDSRKPFCQHIRNLAGMAEVPDWQPPEALNTTPLDQAL